MLLRCSCTAVRRQVLRRSLCTATVLSPAIQGLKQRHRTTLEGLERTLLHAHAHDEDLAVLRDSIINLEGLFLLCTVGEFNSGKSSLINALLGVDHCKVGVIPTTAAVTLLRHPSATDFHGAGAASEVLSLDVPTPWLRDVSVVDTPGTNTLDATHTALTQDFLPRADSLLFITSAERPLSESEVAFLRKIRAWGKKVTLVVNKADVLASADELRQVLAYVEEHAYAELGERAPVLAVSARTAFALKQRVAAASGVGGAVGLGADLKAHAADEAEGAAATQWEALEAHVLSVLQSDARAAAKLDGQRRVASALLRKYEAQQRGAMELVEQDVSVISTARHRLDAWEEGARSDLDARRAEIKVVMHALGQRGQDFLQEELTLLQLPRLLDRDAFVERFQTRVVADANATLQRTLEEVAAWMEHKGEAQARDTLELPTTRLQQQQQLPTEGSAAATAAKAAPLSQQQQQQQQHHRHAEVPYHVQRHALVLELHKAGATTMERYDPSSAARRMATAAQASIAQAALLQAGAAGVTGMVAVKAAALTDLTGLLPAALLLATGLGLLPMQRLRLQREYRLRIDELTASLDAAVHAHLLRELSASKARCLDLVAPFATLVKGAHAQQAGQLKALDEAREQLDALRRDARDIVHTSRGAGGDDDAR